MSVPLKDIYNRLFSIYGPQHWWPASSPYEMMVGAILTQNTNWSNVDKALSNFSGTLSPQKVLSLPRDELINMIRPSGFFNQKADRLIKLTKWYEGFDFNMEKVKAYDTYELRKQLLNISGVGRETADSILLYAAEKPIFVVDAYTRRLLHRLGFGLEEDYDKIRMFFEQELNGDAPLYNEFHALIVAHAKVSCRKIPDCARCRLNDICMKLI